MSCGLAGTKFLNPLFQTTESLNGHTEVSRIGNAKFPKVGHMEGREWKVREIYIAVKCAMSCEKGQSKKVHVPDR